VAGARAKRDLLPCFARRASNATRARRLTYAGSVAGLSHGTEVWRIAVLYEYRDIVVKQVVKVI